jgi:caffeoyl-CoA O-methyltransferase
MNKAFGNEDQRLASYVTDLYQPEDAELAEIRQRAAAEGLPDIQVAALDARHLEVLVRMTGVRRAVEVGTLAGYSGLSILRGMLPDGLLFTVEAEQRHAQVAAETFRRAGQSARVRQLVGNARVILPTLSSEGPFDFCFIDADKESYERYLEWAAGNLRPGGVVVADNAFLFGELGRDAGAHASAALHAMAGFHKRLASSGEFRSTVFPTGEGLAVGVKI